MWSVPLEACKTRMGPWWEKAWHPEVTSAAWHAVSTKSLLAGSYLLQEICAGATPNLLLPFPLFIPSRPPPLPPLSPLLTSTPSEATSFLPPNRAGTRPPTAQPQHKGEGKPKINTHAPPVRTALGMGRSGEGKAMGGWPGGEEEFHAGLFKGVLFVQGCPNICGALAGPECVRELRQRVLGVGKLCSPQPLQACSPSGSDSIKPAPEIY